MATGASRSGSIKSVTNGDQKLPDFIAVGPPRTGTTWLYRMLAGHVTFPPRIKETNFFSSNFSEGLAWYQSHFRDSSAGLPIGEVCPTYFDYPEARERIARLIPRCRIIVTLRDPVQRLYSHYRLLRSLGWLGPVDLTQALALHREWTGPGNILGASIYSTHLKAWLNSFGEQNLLVLLYDDLVRDRQAYLDQACAFVGIARIDLSNLASSEERVNPRETAPRSAWLARRATDFRDRLRRRRLYALSESFRPLWMLCFAGGEQFPPLDPAIESRLRNYFRSDVEQLEQLLQRDLSAWK
jgi:sulfotransferase family protein